ncbi:SlyX family protein [Roseiconus lacunae]|uniref:SlyX family protein n=1 Tax=Roseiconus lacunae TaxID=2605694 RepID=A0ABT7PIM2_9BACT|nr:SlyX family protein [Roseiconus lacunae]MCD0461210.1 SlyX family protein [Roseiconus lacunae]MDM4016036.1 SlyX family protein [Roseiconus lacunae]WRQ51630.1 SlyX family protein [Stieleria sp. HD01]
MKDHSDRIIELESQLAHLQRQYDELNQVVIDQTRDIQRLLKQALKWEQDLDRLKHAVEPRGELADEKPPHY